MKNGVLVNSFQSREDSRKSEKPFVTQVMLLLNPDRESTALTWIVESEEAGIVQLAEPILIRQTEELIRKSMRRLKAYIKTK